ncbi:flagellar export chaperone FliS [Paucidesulfovibrio longus]|uniref:flagellar export chaperone FliS n=1 Tax=Paucidesulfovibrio longus TaxID=889 RepID=UPI0003B4B4C0|nr:flagellar export chaperone FliS [Paucidesulfovibrio longus]
MSKAAHAYLATQVTTTSQGQLLVMLYDAAIKFLKQAKERIEAKDYAKKGILISRAMDIISELANSLNRDKGGKLADNLDSLYMFCNIRLAKANLKMDVRMIDEVLNILTNIRSAYAQIVPEAEKRANGQAMAGLNRMAAMGAAAAAQQQNAEATQQPAQPQAQPPRPETGKAQAQPDAAKPPADKSPADKPQAAPPKPAQPQQPQKEQQPAQTSLSKSVNLLRQRAASAYNNSL